jgi:hypothetical protein
VFEFYDGSPEAEESLRLTAAFLNDKAIIDRTCLIEPEAR